MAEILLIYPMSDKHKECRFGFSLTLAYIGAALLDKGHNVTFRDYSIIPFNRKEFEQDLATTDIAIIEFDAFTLKRTTNIIHANELAERIKSIKPDVKSIAVGHDCVLFPQNRQNIDYTYSSEPEFSIHMCVSMLLKNEKPLPDTFKNIKHDLNELPYPARNLLPSFAEYGGSLFKKQNLGKSTLIQTSRGCLNTCTFCQRRGWREGFRSRSIENIIKEFEMLQQKNYKNIWISDDNFTFNLARSKKILSELSANGITDGMKIALSSWTQIDTDFLTIAAGAGVSIISFGIESINENVLNYYKKNINPDRVARLITYANSIGVYTVGNFIIGAPIETEENISKTFEYALETPFDEVNVKILTYMAGSELYEQISPELRGEQRSILACHENALNSFYLDEMRLKIDNFMKIFKSSRLIQISKKIEKYGPPYILQKAVV